MTDLWAFYQTTQLNRLFIFQSSFLYSIVLYICSSLTLHRGLRIPFGIEPLRPSWISDRRSFSSFRPRNHPVATEQVSAQGDQRFGKSCQKLTYKIAALTAILDFLLAHLANLCLLSTLMPIIKFGSKRIIDQLFKICILNIFPI